MFIMTLMVNGCSDGSDRKSKQIDMTNLTALEAVKAMKAMKAMKAGEFTPTEYATALLERAEQLEHLNAFIYLNPGEVREAARKATEKLKSGEPVGALIGLPLTVKDSVDTAGIPTTGGTPSLTHNIPKENTIPAGVVG
jgi:Asp-tRNA(Asn)/Glu-tRNA(Gln) amidotransferase A subunit family amidase